MDIRGDKAKIVQEIPNTSHSTYFPMSDLRVWTNKPVKEQGVAEGLGDALKGVWDKISDFDSMSPKYNGNTPRREALRKKLELQKKQQQQQKQQQGVAEGSLNEFAIPDSDDGNDRDPEEILFQLARQWWTGTEQDMIRAQRTLEAMGWEIGEDEGYDNGGVFVVRAGDVNGKSYISWPHEDLALDEGVNESKCPHCGGPMFSEMIMNEKKDACYYKVKSRYKVWPSAYASGALVKCRKKGAKNWGNK